MTNHYGCTVRAIRCTTRRSNKSLRVNGEIFKESFVSATKFCRRNKSHKFCLIWFSATCCSDKILLLRQRFSQKFFSTHVRFVAATCRCNLLPSVYRPSNSTLETLSFPRDCCIIFCEEIKQGNVWKVARRCLSWTSLNFYVYAWPFIQVREDKILSILSIVRAWTSVILAGKRDSCRLSTTSLARISMWQKQING